MDSPTEGLLPPLPMTSPRENRHSPLNGSKHQSPLAPTKHHVVSTPDAGFKEENKVAQESLLDTHRESARNNQISRDHSLQSIIQLRPYSHEGRKRTRHNHNGLLHAWRDSRECRTRLRIHGWGRITLPHTQGERVTVLVQHAWIGRKALVDNSGPSHSQRTPDIQRRSFIPHHSQPCHGFGE